MRVVAIVLAVPACAILAGAGGPQARAEGLEAGLWRTVQTPEIDGTQGPPREAMRCLTAAEVSDLDRLFSPVSRTTNSPCEMVEHEFTPQRLKWRLQCKGQADQEVAGEFVFERRDRYTATIDARFSMLGKQMHRIRTTIAAEWVGECR